MLIRRRWAAALLLAACSSPLAAPTEVAAPPVVASARPIIAKLVTRDAELAIVSTGTGVRFSIVSTEGAVLAGDLGEAELKTQYPDLYRFYRSAIAHGGRPYFDATLTRPLDGDREDLFR
jgi:hypothetical protein